MNSGANIDAVDKNGQTALHFAVSEKKIEIMKFLVDKEANIDIKNKKQQTPYTLARKIEIKDTKKEMTMAKYLLQKK